MGNLGGHVIREGKRAIFVGCARSCAEHLPAVLRNIERFAGLFTASAFVFAENDSSDSTRRILEQWGTEKRLFHLIRMSGFDAVVPQRTVRLEMLRSGCVEFVRKSEELRAFDYLIVMDCDRVCAGEIEIAKFTAALEFLEQDRARAGVFANNLGPYADLWALRHPTLCPNDVWEEAMDYSLTHRVTDEITFKNTFLKRVFSIDPSSPAVEVESAFNGFGIYKTSYVLESKNLYLGAKLKVVVADNEIGIMRIQTCEHVHFHQGIRNAGGTLFIMPDLTLFEVKDAHSRTPPSVWRHHIF